MFPRQAQDEFWSPDPQRTLASSFLGVQPGVTPLPGGIRLSGRWRFSSNVDHCDGIILLVMLPGQGGPPRQNFAVLHRDQYAIEDTWNVVGLAATGSNDVEGWRCPGGRISPAGFDVDPQRRRAGRPGEPALPLRAAAVCRVLPRLIGSSACAAPQGALDQIVESLTGKTSVANVKLAEQPTVQARVAEAAAEIEAARALLQADRARINDMGRLRLLPDDETRVRYRLDVGYAAKLCVQAIERLMPIVGGRGLELADPFQRAWRDAHAVAQHIALTWDLQVCQLLARCGWGQGRGCEDLRSRLFSGNE